MSTLHKMMALIREIAEELGEPANEFAVKMFKEQFGDMGERLGIFLNAQPAADPVEGLAWMMIETTKLKKQREQT